MLTGKDLKAFAALVPDDATLEMYVNADTPDDAWVPLDEFHLRAVLMPTPPDVKPAEVLMPAPSRRV